MDRRTAENKDGYFCCIQHALAAEKSYSKITVAGNH